MRLPACTRWDACLPPATATASHLPPPNDVAAAAPTSSNSAYFLGYLILFDVLLMRDSMPTKA
ncbi:hypothetical protein CC79DRAFT_1336139 [Sarocladium strictum]